MKAGIDYIGVSVGALIFNKNGEILLCKRSQNAKNEKGKWEAPGGAVDFFEKREDAIKREVKEELGITIEILGIVHDAAEELLEKDRQHWISTCYVAKIKRGKPKILEPHKCEKVGWFKLSRLPRPLSFITTLDAKDYKEKFNGRVPV